jgi:lipase ATG15
MPPPQRLRLTPRNYHYALSQYVQQLLASAVPRANVIVVGHSLGGGLAKIVGVSNNVTAVSISGPGILLSRHKFALTKQGIMYGLTFPFYILRFALIARAHTTDVTTDKDVVPLIDTHGGTQYRLDCAKSTPHHHCHYLTAILAQMLALCDDGHQVRRGSTACLICYFCVCFCFFFVVVVVCFRLDL